MIKLKRILVAFLAAPLLTLPVAGIIFFLFLVFLGNVGNDPKLVAGAISRDIISVLFLAIFPGLPIKTGMLFLLRHFGWLAIVPFFLSTLIATYGLFPFVRILNTALEIFQHEKTETYFPYLISLLATVKYIGVGVLETGLFWVIAFGFCWRVSKEVDTKELVDSF